MKLISRRNSLQTYFLQHYTRLLTLLLATLIFVPGAYAQKEKNNIYLFDCTNSMQKGGLWQPAQDALDATITTQAQTEGAQFTVIPFGDDPYKVITFDNQGYNGQKSAIRKSFDEKVKKARSTNISKVLNSAFAKCDPNKDNKIYLLTDGEPNGGDSPEKVAQLIKKWCDNHKNTRLFYVALKEGVVPDAIRKTIEECPDAYIVQCKNNVIPQISDVDLEIYTNINELDVRTHTLIFSEANCPLNVSCNDPIFTAEIVGGKSTNDGKVNVKIKGRTTQDVGQLHEAIQPFTANGEPYKFSIFINSGDSRYIVANPEVPVYMADHIQSRLSLAGEADELAVDGTSWHGAFLCSDASAPGEVEFDLTPEFKDIEPGRLTGIRLLVAPAEDEPYDFKCYFNGRELARDETFIIRPGDEAKLRVVFNTDAKTGKRYFQLLNRGSDNIDLINNQPFRDFTGLSLRTKYSRNWNPLATLFFWIGMLLLAALILWFLVLRRIFYPLIKVGSIEFAGPATYFTTKKLKGSIKVICSSKKRSQNIFSRIFQGKISFIRADHFSPEIEILPSGKRKKIRIRPLNKGDNAWDIIPTAILAPYEKATLSHRSRPEKSDISIT